MNGIAVPWSVKDLRAALFSSQQVASKVNGTLANVLENHDQPRVLSKLVPDKQNQTPAAAKALATMYYFLPGIPFIYQGQELGMKNFVRDDISEFNDVSSINNYQMALKDGYSKESALSAINDKSRDNARVPMQWDHTEFAGFSDVAPWLKMGSDRTGIDVQTELADKNSVLNYYKKLGAWHHDPVWQKVITTGDLQPLSSLPETVIGYQRILVCKHNSNVNLSPDASKLTGTKMVRFRKSRDVTINENIVCQAWCQDGA